MKMVGIVQPTYLPWLPFFQRMAEADVFVYLDDVKYSKNSFHNRNAIKGVDKSKTMLTVPVRYRGHSRALISEIAIDNSQPWRKKHWGTVRSNYSRAIYWSRYSEQLEELYTRRYEKLIDVLMPFIDFFRSELQITTPALLSSEIPVVGVGNEKLVNICKYVSGTHFMVKPGTEHYHPAHVFESGGIELRQWQAANLNYQQIHGGFEPGLSALDYVLNCGSVDLVAAYA